MIYDDISKEESEERKARKEKRIEEIISTVVDITFEEAEEQATEEIHGKHVPGSQLPPGIIIDVSGFSGEKGLQIPHSLDNRTIGIHDAKTWIELQAERGMKRKKMDNVFEELADHSKQRKRSLDKISRILEKQTDDRRGSLGKVSPTLCMMTESAAEEQTQGEDTHPLAAVYIGHIGKLRCKVPAYMDSGAGCCMMSEEFYLKRQHLAVRRLYDPEVKPPIDISGNQLVTVGLAKFFVTAGYTTELITFYVAKNMPATIFLGRNFFAKTEVGINLHETFLRLTKKGMEQQAILPMLPADKCTSLGSMMRLTREASGAATTAVAASGGPRRLPAEQSQQTRVASLADSLCAWTSTRRTHIAAATSACRRAEFHRMFSNG